MASCAAAAKRAGVSVSAFVRSAALGKARRQSRRAADAQRWAMLAGVMARSAGQGPPVIN